MRINLCITVDNWITDLDFNKEGKRVAMIDHSGTSLISDVDTNAYLSHLKPSSSRTGMFNIELNWFVFSILL